MGLYRIAVSWFCLVFAINARATCLIEGMPINMSDHHTLNIIGEEVRDSFNLKGFDGVHYNPLNWRNWDEGLGVSDWVNFLSKHPKDRAVMGEFLFTHTDGTEFRLVCDKIEKHSTDADDEFILENCDWAKFHNTRGYLQGRLNEKEREKLGLPEVKSHPIKIPLEKCLCKNG
jgi:hypothetical protein